jgi:hypothetical protein
MLGLNGKTSAGDMLCMSLALVKYLEVVMETQSFQPGSHFLDSGWRSETGAGISLIFA